MSIYMTVYSPNNYGKDRVASVKPRKRRATNSDGPHTHDTDRNASSGKQPTTPIHVSR